MAYRKIFVCFFTIRLLLAYVFLWGAPSEACIWDIFSYWASPKNFLHCPTPLLADFFAVFSHISPWYLSLNIYAADDTLAPHIEDEPQIGSSMLLISRMNPKMGSSMLPISMMNPKMGSSTLLIPRMNPETRSSMLPSTRMRLPACKKRPLLACFWLFWRSSFAGDLYLWANHVYFAKKISPDLFSWPQGGSKHFTTP